MDQILMTRVAPRGFVATEAEERYARLLLDPAAPKEPGPLAAKVGVDLQTMLAFYDRPGFAEWLAVQVERLAAPLVMQLWGRIYQDAAEALDPKVRMEASRMFLARFDPTLRAPGLDLKAVGEAFGRRVAAEALKRAPVRRVAAVVREG